MEVNGIEALQLHAVLKKPYFNILSHMRIHISAAKLIVKSSISIMSHMRICIRYYKSPTLRLNMQ